MNQPFVYHIMIDRFVSCDPKRKGRCFKGGNLRGIINKLDYIQSLGCNGILLTPFYVSNEYHGYHILSFEQVDPHFGNWNDVDMLVVAAHRRGMMVMADFVANHCHINNPIVEKNRNWFKRRKDGSFVGLFGIKSLPQFNLDIVGAQNFIIEKGKELCSHGFDAIRLDYAKGPSLTFWKRFKEEIKKSYPNVLLVGEIWGTPIGKHLDSKLANKVMSKRISVQEAWQMNYIGIFDGVIDFEYHSIICNAIRTKQGILRNKQLLNTLEMHFSHYAGAADFQLWLFLDNHDTNRFLFECNGDIALLNEAILLTKQLNRPFLYYYGTEKGMSNETSIFSKIPHADEQVRKCMEWNNKTII